jgi:hypothetical protein
MLCLEARVSNCGHSRTNIVLEAPHLAKRRGAGRRRRARGAPRRNVSCRRPRARRGLGWRGHQAGRRSCRPYGHCNTKRDTPSLAAGRWSGLSAGDERGLRGRLRARLSRRGGGRRPRGVGSRVAVDQEEVREAALFGTLEDAAKNLSRDGLPRRPHRPPAPLRRPRGRLHQPAPAAQVARRPRQAPRRRPRSPRPGRLPDRVPAARRSGMTTRDSETPLTTERGTRVLPGRVRRAS